MTSLSEILKLPIPKTNLFDMADGIKAFVKSLDNLSSLENEDVSRMKELNEALPIFTEAIKGFTANDEAGNLIKTLNGIKEAVSGIGDKKNNPFDKINESVVKTTSSLSGLNKELDKTISKMQKLAAESKKAFAAALKKAENSDKVSSSSSSGGNIGSNKDMSIEDIIKKWDNDGVPVRGFGSQTKPDQKIFTI